MSYSMFLVVCIALHIIINVDIFRKKATISLPAIRFYRVFVASMLLFFITDFLWGIFEEQKMAMALYIDTVFYFIFMSFTFLAWAKYITGYLQGAKWWQKTVMYLANAFFLAEIVLLIVNIFTPVLFSVNFETCEYLSYKARRIMLYVQILLFFLLIVYSIITAIKLERGSFKRRYITIALYSLIMGVLVSLQIYYPYLPLYSIGCITGIVLLNSYVVTDIKEEYKVALEKTRKEVQHGQEELQEAKIIAYTDPLSNIKNKHAYVEEEDRIDKLIAQGQMEDFAVVVFDLNGLKLINDTKGHDAGDVYIVDACKIIEKYFGHENIYRFGGDEFVAILTKETYEKRTTLLADFEKLIDDSLNTENPIISSGMSRYRPGKDNTYHAVFYRADRIMYSRKETLKEHNS